MNKKVLIADDEIGIAEGIKTLLISNNVLSVDIATSGIGALRLYKKNKYDALILDVDFGAGITGIEVAATIRKVDSEISIILFSAIDYSNDVQSKVIELGAIFQEKPIDPNEILEYLKVL